MSRRRRLLNRSGPLGVLPDIAAENGLAALHEGVLAVERLHHDDLAILDRKPAPAGAELRDAGLNEFLLCVGDGTEIGGNLFFELASPWFLPNVPFTTSSTGLFSHSVPLARLLPARGPRPTIFVYSINCICLFGEPSRRPFRLTHSAPLARMLRTGSWHSSDLFIFIDEYH
jgi:hypothetical protein